MATSCEIYIRLQGEWLWRQNHSHQRESRGSAVASGQGGHYYLRMDGTWVSPVFVAHVCTPSVQGYFLLFESMLDTVIFARDKWLKDQARGIYCCRRTWAHTISFKPRSQYSLNVGTVDPISIRPKCMCSRSTLVIWPPLGQLGRNS